jgi:hypothetical protein
MDSAMVGQVRRFNRVVTQRAGALHDQFLARPRSLGQSRLLWEIGPAGCDVRLLRTRPAVRRGGRVHPERAERPPAGSADGCDG